jgi:membrane protease YdiL (CAAX protease family)
MKRILVTLAKSIGFYLFWIASISLMAIPAFSEPSFLKGHDSFLRLWWELIPLIGILAATVFFVLVVEKNRIKVPLKDNILKNIGIGLFFGVVWIGATISIISVSGILHIESRNEVSYLPVWFVAVLINAIMQEFLVRGYLFSLLKEKFNSIAAIIITTVLFTAMHGGVFEAGIIPVLNVITMSIFVSVLLLYTRTLIAPIIAHFIWNGVGSLVFGVVSLADDYPNIYNTGLSGDTLFSGGVYKIEGSIIVLAVNLLLTILVVVLLKKCSKRELPLN